MIELLGAGSGDAEDVVNIHTSSPCVGILPHHERRVFSAGATEIGVGRVAAAVVGQDHIGVRQCRRGRKRLVAMVMARSGSFHGCHVEGVLLLAKLQIQDLRIGWKLEAKMARGPTGAGP